MKAGFIVIRRRCTDRNGGLSPIAYCAAGVLIVPLFFVVGVSMPVVLPVPALIILLPAPFGTEPFVMVPPLKVPLTGGVVDCAVPGAVVVVLLMEVDVCAKAAPASARLKTIEPAMIYHGM